MLLHLHIRNFAIVPALEQDFLPGFTAISGETGAGKSILVDALGLLLGARSDAAWVRSGEDRAELTAEFGLATNAPARDWLREHELDDGESVLLRRSIQSSGRSRAWVNGTPVTVAQLAELGHLLVEVHGQNEHVRLASPARQLSLVDRTGNFREVVDATAEAFEGWRRADEKLREMAKGAALPPSELEFLAFQRDELEEERLEPAAIEELEREHRLLAASGSLVQSLERCAALLDEDGDDAAGRLAMALTALEPFEGLSKRVDEARRMLDEALINTREAAAALAAESSRVDLDPERLEAVESRLSRLGDLARKHGVDLEELGAVRDRLRERLELAEHFDEARAGLEKERDERLAAYRKQSKELSANRARHGETLAARVEALMGDLGMQGGRFVVTLRHDSEMPPSRQGNDRIEMHVSANPGIAPAPLSKVASGGELSRISLAIKVATADHGARVQVFDEVDAGVGGDTANAVGDLLRQAASGGQALCVTHLAQVAVRADQQLKVTKEAVGEHTEVDAGVLAEADRVEEIARMLGGKVSDQSRAHAREMLEAARSTLQ